MPSAITGGVAGHCGPRQRSPLASCTDPPLILDSIEIIAAEQCRRGSVAFRLGQVIGSGGFRPLDVADTGPVTDRGIACHAPRTVVTLRRHSRRVAGHFPARRGKHLAGCLTATGMGHGILALSGTHRVIENTPMQGIEIDHLPLIAGLDMLALKPCCRRQMRGDTLTELPTQARDRIH